MKVEVVLSETDIAQEFVEAIEARDLPEKFFYWLPKSATEWAAFAVDEDLYGGLRASWKEIGADAAALAKDFGPRVPVISFGAGEGSRDRILMNALKDVGSECQYFPVDASQALLEIACAGAEDDDIETVGIKADISSPVHLVYAADAAEPARIFIMSGNTMGSFDPLAEIRYIGQCMKPVDWLIVDGELYEEQENIRRRNTAIARRFVTAVLEGVGIGSTEGIIGFSVKRDERRQGLFLITRFFHAEQDLTVIANAQEISLERGERIGLNFQYVYTPEAFRWLVSEHGRLDIQREYTSPDGRFLTVICKK